MPIRWGNLVKANRFPKQTTEVLPQTILPIRAGKLFIARME